MATTVNTVLTDIAATIDQDTSAVSGTDLLVRVNLINQAQREWAEAYQWKDLRFRYAPSTILSAFSAALPTNFKKLMSPVYDVVLSSANNYIEINPSDKFLKASTKRYVYVQGSNAAGYGLFINPPLLSGVSLNLEYQAYPSSLATTIDTISCPNPQFITYRVLGQILAARTDERFPQFKAYADEQLQNMVEEEITPSGGQDNTTPTYLKRDGYEIGVD